MNKIKIIIAKVDNLKPYVGTATRMISPRYSKKYYLSKSQTEANQAIVTGLLLRKYLGVWSNEEFIIGKHGKPSLKNGDVYFNISHSNEFVVLAVADIPVGVDIEQIAKVCWPAAKRVLTGEQYESLYETNEKEQAFAFAKLWTETEAVLKLTGSGFTMDPKNKNFKKIECTVNSILHNKYIITCATYDEAEIVLEEAQVIEIIQEKEVKK